MVAVASTIILAACSDRTEPPRVVAGADAARGLETMKKVGCGACHVIPGLDWPQGRAGPSLDGFGRRPLVAGRLPNQPDTLAAFLRDASSLAPGTGMPAMPVSEAEARDMAAYLYAQRD